MVTGLLWRAPAVLAMGVLLTGCGSLGSALGITKTPPDEFAVVTKAPLVIPPDYTLRPPTPGAPRPQEQTPSGIAREAVFPAGGGSDAAVSGAEAALLTATGGDRANPDIRATINAETSALVDKERSFADRLLFWQTPGEEPATVVDARSEAERLRAKDAKGEPVSGTDTPVVKESGGSLLDRIF